MSKKSAFKPHHVLFSGKVLNIFNKFVRIGYKSYNIISTIFTKNNLMMHRQHYWKPICPVELTVSLNNRRTCCKTTLQSNLSLPLSKEAVKTTIVYPFQAWSIPMRHGGRQMLHHFFPWYNDFVHIRVCIMFPHCFGNSSITPLFETATCWHFIWTCIIWHSIHSYLVNLNMLL